MTGAHSTGAVEALDAVKENCRRAYRSAEMSAEIMRDARRTGGWEGAERTARAFDRIAKDAKAAHDGLSDLCAALERAPAVGPSREAWLDCPMCGARWGLGFRCPECDKAPAILPQAQDESIVRAPSFTGLAGWKLVPREPTGEMVGAGTFPLSKVLNDDEGRRYVCMEDLPVLWRDMYDAAPSTPAHETAREPKPSAELITELCEALIILRNSPKWGTLLLSWENWEKVEAAIALAKAQGAAR